MNSRNENPVQMDIRQAALANLESRRPVVRVAPGASQYLCFQIAGKYYAIAYESVREMMPVQAPATWVLPVPGLLGVIHSRNHRIPVVDIHARLHLKVRPRRRAGRIIVAVLADGAQFAFFADTISDILEVHAADVHANVIQGHGRPKAILSVRDLVTDAQIAVFA